MTRPSHRLAWGLCAAAVVFTLLAAVLRIMIAGHDVPSDHQTGSGDVVWFAVIISFALIGALIASRQPRNPIGWIFCAGTVAFSLAGVTEAYAIYTLFAKPGSLLGGGETAGWFSVWVWVLGGVPLITLFPLLFPTGRLLTWRWRHVARAAVASAFFLSIGIALSPGEFDDLPGVENPYGVGGAAGDVFTAFQSVGWLLLFISMIAASTSLVLRFRRSRGIERQQIKWVAAAGVVLVASFFMWGVWEGMAPLGILTMVVAAGVAILRYRLYDIDVVINRTLVYGALTATLALAYLGGVLLLQLALRPLTESSNLAIAVSTLGVAALFRPARARIQEMVDRRFYRRKYDAQLTLAAFSTRLRDQVDLGALRSELSGVVQETLQPAHVSLWLRAPEMDR